MFNNNFITIMITYITIVIMIIELDIILNIYNDNKLKYNSHNDQTWRDN